MDRSYDDWKTTPEELDERDQDYLENLEDYLDELEIQRDEMINKVDDGNATYTELLTLEEEIEFTNQKLGK